MLNTDNFDDTLLKLFVTAIRILLNLDLDSTFVWSTSLFESSEEIPRKCNGISKERYGWEKLMTSLPNMGFKTDSQEIK